MNKKEKNQVRYKFWCAVKNGEFKKPETCSHCGKKKRLDSHHHLGYEGDNWKNVVWLCRKCHQIEHREIFDLIYRQRKGHKLKSRSVPNGFISATDFAQKEGISSEAARHYFKDLGIKKSIYKNTEMWVIPEDLGYKRQHMTLETFGKSQGISRQRVWQLMKKGRISHTVEYLGKMRPSINSHILPFNFLLQ